MTTIKLSSIDESDRYRKDYGDLSGLWESMSGIGQIHAIVLFEKSNNTYGIVAGGRRFRAMKQNGVTELHHGDEGILAPGKFAYVLKSEVSEDVLKEAEIDENMYRLKPKWQEDCLAIADLHELKRKKAREAGTKWGQRQTAALLGAGFGLSNVNYALKVADALRKGDEQIIQCATMMDAMSVLVKRKEDEALAELTRRSSEKLKAGGGSSTSSFLDTINISFGPKKVEDPAIAGAMDILAPVLPVERSTATVQAVPVAPSAPVEVPLSNMFTHGDCLKVMADLPDACIDHVVTDIPYGIDMENLDEKQVADVKAEHDVEYNIDMMPKFLAQAYRLIKPSGFCVFFYDLDHHEKLQAWARDIGFRVQRWPFIACKTSASQNNAAQYNTTKNYEACMFLRRDERTVLRQPMSTSWKAYDFNAERRLYNNPFAKPFELWKDIYTAIAFPGQSILDPYCGEMSGSRAAVNCGLVPFGIEINKQHFNRGLEHMRAVYALVHKSNVIFK